MKQTDEGGQGLLVPVEEEKDNPKLDGRSKAQLVQGKFGSL
jgi:hypothetical protein